MKKLSLTFAAVLALAGAAAHAQTGASSSAAEPASAMPATSASSATAARAARHEAWIEKRISYLHKQLKITPAQEPQWKTFADTMRENGETMGKLYRERMADKNLSALDDIRQYADMMQANAQDAKKLADAFAPLYDSFPPEQKALADKTFREWLHHGHRRGHRKGEANKPATAASGAAAQ